MKIVKYAETKSEPGVICDFEKRAIAIAGDGETLAAMEMTPAQMLELASELIEMSRSAEAAEVTCPEQHRSQGS